MSGPYQGIHPLKGTQIVCPWIPLQGTRALKRGTYQILNTIPCSNDRNRPVLMLLFVCSVQGCAILGAVLGGLAQGTKPYMKCTSTNKNEEKSD